MKMNVCIGHRQNRICGSERPKRLPGGFIAEAFQEQLSGLSNKMSSSFTLLIKSIMQELIITLTVSSQVRVETARDGL